MLDERQTEIWDALCQLSAEDVALMFTNYYGNQLLSEDFREFLVQEGVLPDEDF